MRNEQTDKKGNTDDICNSHSTALFRLLQFTVNSHDNLYNTVDPWAHLTNSLSKFANVFLLSKSQIMVLEL